MRLTVIYDDHYISVDGYGIHFVDNWPFDEENIHAIQWYDDHGELEYKNTDPNLQFTDYIRVEKYLTHFDREKERILEEERRLQEEEQKKQEMWHLAMQELQRELNETKMNYEMSVRNYEEVKTNLNTMSKSYQESQMHLLVANQINEEIQRMQEEINSVQYDPDNQILNIIQPNVIDNISEFSDGVDMSMFEDDSTVKQIEELQSMDSERTEFDISLLEDEFNIELIDDTNIPENKENEEDYILSIESLLDELELDLEEPDDVN
jgi:hypothetical protein